LTRHRLSMKLLGQCWVIQSEQSGVRNSQPFDCLKFGYGLFRFFKSSFRSLRIHKSVINAHLPRPLSGNGLGFGKRWIWGFSGKRWVGISWLPEIEGLEIFVGPHLRFSDHGSDEGLLSFARPLANRAMQSKKISENAIEALALQGPTVKCK